LKDYRLALRSPPYAVISERVVLRFWFAFRPNYTVPNHSHTSDELYVWLKCGFTYIAADGKQVEMGSPAYISLPGNTPHALKCQGEPCIFYLRYSRPFDWHVHPMPK